MSDPLVVGVIYYLLFLLLFHLAIGGVTFIVIANAILKQEREVNKGEVNEPVE